MTASESNGGVLHSRDGSHSRRATNSGLNLPASQAPVLQMHLTEVYRSSLTERKQMMQKVFQYNLIADFAEWLE